MSVNAKFLQPKPIIYFPMLIFIGCLIYMLTFKTHNYYQTKTLVSCQNECQFDINFLDLQNTPKINYLIIDNQKYSTPNITFAKPIYNEQYMAMTQAAHITLDLDESYNNQYTTVTIVADEQRIIQKIFKILKIFQ